MQRLKKLVSKRSFANACIGIGVAGIGASIVIYLNEPKPHVVAWPKSVNVVQMPSSVKPSMQVASSYSVPPDDPKYIALPSIGITNTPVLKLGLLASGAIATPNNIYETGWYDGSSLPGAPGAMFVYGHVSSWTADGIFYNLKKLVPGDKVIVTRGDNATYTYRVISSKIYPYNSVNMDQVLSPIYPNDPGLNLMTCTGQVMNGTSEFNERLVVFTSLSKG